MDNFGTRLKELRVILQLSQKDLADKVNISEKTIQRYEKGSNPDIYALAKLATYFNVSSDYLLGLKGYKAMLAEREEKIKNVNGDNELYRKYIQCLNNEIDEQMDYYWIALKAGRISGYTKWVGWSDERRSAGIRKLCTVLPKRAIEMCEKLEEKPLIINSEMDFVIFYIYGGQAIVRKDICETYLTEFNKEYYGKNNIKD